MFALQMIGLIVLFFAATTLAEPKLHCSYTNAPTAEALGNYNEVSQESDCVNVYRNSSAAAQNGRTSKLYS